jgi:hypothetical protein
MYNIWTIFTCIIDKYIYLHSSLQLIEDFLPAGRYELPTWQQHISSPEECAPWNKYADAAWER